MFVILSIIPCTLGIFLFAGGAYKGALSWSDKILGTTSSRTSRDGRASRRPAAPSRHLRESSPGMRKWMVYFSSLSTCRTASLPRRTPTTETGLQSLITLFYPSVTGVMAG